eukprot:CAMPEP_0168542596 /NCGR_PEP_ID=MMETSP0413-20121227/1429_1 /TAXON_ID=136452 /ORGANISM="Filamoeba nolandi, Strain NC-AS-23-1" /LENGTH=119 /DNA_ID=CAMNT_0008572477 /DNA_START=156 /DNA_END=512 /DNA_ORIENTATION=+
MDDYFGTFEGAGENWKVDEEKRLPKYMLSNQNDSSIYVSCECHLPIGYSKNKNFIRGTASQVGEKMLQLIEAINQSAQEQNGICYYASRSCADECGNYDEEYGESCWVLILPSEVFVLW